MTNQQAQQRIRDVIERLKAETPGIALRQAQTAVTLLKERSINTGIEVNGSYAEYSTRPIARKFFAGKALNSSGNAWIAKGGKGTWGEFREVQGRKSDNVNLFYTGRMWTSFGILSASQAAGRYGVLVGNSDREATRVMIDNLKHYGNFLALKPTEIARIRAGTTAEIRTLFALLP